MALIRWRPFDLTSMFDEDFELPTVPFVSRLGQGLNLYETEDAVVAEAAVPGVPEDKIDITVENNVVRVTGSYEEKQEEKGKRRYFMSSMASSFNYSFRLPEGIVADEEPECELADGVLELTFKKVKKAPPKKIQVKAKPKTK